MIKIVHGNGVKLTFPFFEKLENGSIAPLDMSTVTDLAVKFIRANGEEIVLEGGFNVKDNNVIVVVPCYTEIGKYHVSISGMIGNSHICSTLKECFSIVQFNSDGNYTESRSSSDIVIEDSVLLRVDVDEHEIPVDGTDTEPSTDDNTETTPSSSTSDSGNDDGNDSGNENTEGVNNGE